MLGYKEDTQIQFLNMVLFTLVTVLIILSFVYYLLAKWKHQYWSKKGVPQLEPHLIFGDLKPVFTGKVAFQQHLLDIYKNCKAKGYKQVGLYNFLSPEWMPMDLSIIKPMLTKDYIYFAAHGMYHHEKEPLTMHLFSVEGEQWKKMRTRLTPTFTSGKIKMMFDTLLEKTHALKRVITQHAESGKELEIKEIMARFSTDIIGGVAFGIENNSLEEPDNKLRKIGRIAFSPDIFKMLLSLMLPYSLLGNLGFKITKEEVTSYFTDVISQTIRYREENNVQRKDFMQLMLQLKHQGFVSADGESQSNVKGNHMTNQEIITEAFLFYLAGFETSSSATTCAILELAKHQDIQDKLRAEILDVLEQHDGKITYEAIGEMTYLDKVFRETLRKYPPLPFLPRMCTKTYKVPNSDIVIEKGTTVHVPVWGIQKDPEFYPNPEEFNPENFSPENIAKRPDFTWMPFGEGPRLCLGMRFGMMQSKVGIITLLRDFKYSHFESTKYPFELSVGSVVLAVKGNYKIKVEKL